MQFLVTMTTHVPPGLSDETVELVRSREAARSRQLAAQGHLLRLWRPPLRAGEWRTLGLFAAADHDHLEQVLTSMPLRIWRTDDIEPLSAHPNDPVTPDNSGSPDHAEFLVRFAVSIPPGTRVSKIVAAREQEARRAHELGAVGRLRRLWTLPGSGRAIGLWLARDLTVMTADLESLPLAPWMQVDTVPLAPHPNDPGRQAATGESELARPTALQGVLDD